MSLGLGLNWFTRSLSARRAWIEMFSVARKVRAKLVALRKESVDRNKYVVQCRKVMGVALRKESVDRNLSFYAQNRHLASRSPQGERG